MRIKCKIINYKYKQIFAEKIYATATKIFLGVAKKLVEKKFTDTVNLF